MDSIPTSSNEGLSPPSPPENQTAHHFARVVILICVLSVLVLIIGANLLGVSKKEVERPVSQQVVATSTVATSTQVVLASTTPVLQNGFESERKIIPNALEGGPLSTLKAKFPKTIGVYSFVKADGVSEGGNETSYEIVYAKEGPQGARITVFVGTASPADEAIVRKNSEISTYKERSLYCIGVEKNCYWETDGELNVVGIAYVIFDVASKKWVDESVLESGSNAELVMLDWFLQQFPSR